MLFTPVEFRGFHVPGLRFLFPYWPRRIQVLPTFYVETQMSKLDKKDFADLLRAAVKQDEWVLFLHGGVLGAFAGFLHLALFPPG